MFKKRASDSFFNCLALLLNIAVGTVPKSVASVPQSLGGHVCPYPHRQSQFTLKVSFSTSCLFPLFFCDKINNTLNIYVSVSFLCNVFKTFSNRFFIRHFGNVITVFMCGVFLFMFLFLVLCGCFSLATPKCCLVGFILSFINYKYSDVHWIRYSW